MDTFDSERGIVLARQGFYVRGPDGYREVNTGAAELLLDPTFAEQNPAVVLEGAPGQGKSTLSQYLMQVHRARLLGLTEEISALPKFAADGPIMLPVKLELRDLALWLNGIDPWSARQADVHNQTPTLEAAIVAHIQRYSGGVAFSVADLHAILAETPALIVLDALDEVADLDDRKQVVEEVKAGLTRLRQRNKEVRFVITSRPTAIAKSPSFRGEKLTHFSLAPINNELAVDYATRWARVRALEEKDARELLSVLGRRLESPHIAELAKNTMQLTILLNLISLRGPSLPDKRTDLYDTYFQVFMDRESEKDVSVRDNREFLVDLHTYLGYYLHARAEADRSNGRITTSELESLIQEYMTKQQQSPDLLPALTGAVDRIFAIVSRVEGMWEFEVQPLQEYFAARYLYDTAPYSPAGRERSGTKPDIFDGIAPNSYWLNVTRFFAGCFSKGELLDLSDRLAGLISAESSYTRSLGIALVQDWVFTQSTRATDAVLATVFDKTGLRWASGLLTYGGSNPEGETQLSFSRTKEARAVVDLVWERICDSPRAGKAALCRLARAQGVADYVLTKWHEDLGSKSGSERLEWLEVGGWLGLIEDMSADDSFGLIGSFDENYRPAAGAVLIAANGHAEKLSDELAKAAIKFVLDREITLFPAGLHTSPAGWLASANIWIPLIDSLSHVGRRYLAQRVLHRLRGAGTMKNEGPSLIFQQAQDIAARVEELIAAPGVKAGERLSAWSDIVELFVNYFGQSMTANELGVMAGCFRAGRQSGGARSLFDVSMSLVERVRYAKSQLNRAHWWREQSSGIQTDYDRHLWLLCLYAWASPGVIVELIDEIEEQSAQLTEENRAATVGACRRAIHYSPRARAVFGKQQSARLRKLRDSTAICMLYDRMDLSIASELLLKRVEPTASTPYMGNVILDFVGKALLAGDIADQTSLRLMTRGYSLGAVEGCGLRPRTRRSTGIFSAEFAKAILEDSWNIPADVLMVALSIAEDGRPNPEPVMRIAEREGWFGADG